MEITMNRIQYLQWKNREKTILDIKLENKGIDKTDIQKTIITGVAVGGFLLNNPTAVYALDLSRIDVLGNTFLSIVRKASYWIVLVVSLTEICKAAIKGGNSNSEIVKIIVKYLLIYASLFLMPWLFDLVEEAFK